MLNGIGKDIGPDLRSSLLTLGRAQASLALLSLNRSLTLAILLGVLLSAYHDGLRAVTTVNPVDHLVQALHLLYLFSVDVKEILLNGTTGSDTHHDHPRTLVLHPLDEDLVKHLRRSLYDEG